MQETVTRGGDAFAHAAGVEPIRLRHATNLERSRPDAFALWSETLQIISAHSAPILFFMLFGLASAGILGALVGGVTLVTTSARIARYGALSNVQQNQLLVQAIVGFFTFIFARGAITWIALHAADEPLPTIGAAFRATLKRWPALLAQSLVYGVLITLGVTGLILVLRDIRLDISNVGRFYAGISDIPRLVGVRTLAAALPDPGAPFSDILTFIRTSLNRPVAQSFFSATSPRDQSLIPYSVAPALWPIVLGCALVVLLTETLLQLRTVMAMRATGPGSVAGLTDSLRAGIEHFGYITAQVWLVRLVTVAAGVFFTIIPLVFVQAIFLPLYARQVGGYWLYSASTMVFTLGSTLVGVLWTVFAIVFDTRLFAAVTTTAK